VVQQNAALVEEATAATQAMNEQAGSLLQMVARFQLHSADTARAEQDPVALAAGTGSPLASQGA
jgi:deoxyxylulose-5-phosphate synthase